MYSVTKAARNSTQSTIRAHLENTHQRTLRAHSLLRGHWENIQRTLISQRTLSKRSAHLRSLSSSAGRHFPFVPVQIWNMGNMWVWKKLQYLNGPNVPIISFMFTQPPFTRAIFCEKEKCIIYPAHGSRVKDVCVHMWMDFPLKNIFPLLLCQFFALFPTMTIINYLSGSCWRCWHNKWTKVKIAMAVQ